MSPNQKSLTATVPDSVENRLLFICYRQLDGSTFARWIYSVLTEALKSSGDKRPIYFDRTAPAVSDWTTVHGPALETAGSLILICTPGSYSDQGEHDWVHRELDWWLRNRGAPPILVDTTGEGDRWIPAAIRNRWPNAQRVNLDRELWEHLPEQERATVRSQIAQQILGAVVGSEFKTVREDLARTQRLNRSLRFLTYVLGLFLILTVGLGVYLEKARVSARQAEVTAQAQRAQALRILEWVVGETVHLPFDEISLTPEDQEIIRGVIDRLTAMGFQGGIVIEGHIGTFCVASPNVPLLAPSSLPVGKCYLYPASTEYTLALGMRRADALKRYVESIPHPPGLVLRTISYGSGLPLKRYPKAGVARDWNEVALENNGITIRLEEGVGSNLTH